ncbi:MAG TPA: prepilin-type N-terminal cleavage/methylation domain-containing protein [Tepidisphaeraceae bacterium]|nr:prepilin-type N-terminal cleavage/methylation domain-containing protein [Tepidisphaeraceae bacterium]
MRRLRRGFTLVEMLVVIGIILLLIGIATPMINRAYKTAVRTRMAADLQVISMGLEAYKGDFKDYPRLDYAAWNASKTLPSPLNAPMPGAVLLCWSLVGPGPAVAPNTTTPGDGTDGLGFRTRGTSGQVYGPYIAVGRFKIFDVATPTANPVNDALCTINDRYGHPILYFASGLGTNPTGPSGYVADWIPGSANPRPTFNAHDNINAFVQPPETTADTTTALKRLRMMLGDKNHDGTLSPGEVQPANVPYLLWSPGTDEMYGPTFDMTAPDGDIAAKLSTVDDVTNFNP